MAKCKKCDVEKERTFFMLDERQRSVYKDETGKIWHGRVCSTCFTDYVKTMSGKPRLGTVNCVQCGVLVHQRHIRQKYCSRACLLRFAYEDSFVS